MTEVKELGRTFNEDELLSQIGMMNVFAISGGHVIVEKSKDGETEAIELPVGHGYRVRIELDFMDTWNVKRVLYRKGVGVVKGAVYDVYFDYVGRCAYEASLYKSLPDWGKDGSR